MHGGSNLDSLGNTNILKENKLALFCSRQCPGNLILKAYDLARSLRDAGTTVISGFHTPVEKECLRILLRGKQPIIICPARSIEGMRIPSEWRQPIEEYRLLLLSPFEIIALSFLTTGLILSSIFYFMPPESREAFMATSRLATLVIKYYPLWVIVPVVVLIVLGFVRRTSSSSD